MLVTEPQSQFCAKMAQVVLNISTDSTIQVSPSEYATYTKHLCREEIVFFGSDWYRCEKYQLFSCNQRYFDPGYDNTVDPATVTLDAELGSTTTFNCCPGFYCPAQMTCLLPCPPGAYCPAPDYTQNEDTLRPCTGGGYCPTPLVASPIACPPGTYCPTASTQPLPCTSWVPRWDRCDGGRSTNPVFYQSLLSALFFLVLLVVVCEAMQAMWMNPWRTGVPRCYTAATAEVPPPVTGTCPTDKPAGCTGSQAGDADHRDSGVAIVAMVFEEIRIWRHAQLVFTLGAVDVSAPRPRPPLPLSPSKRWVLRPGITALVGLSGAGKSTLLAVLAQRSRMPHQITGSIYLSRSSTPTPPLVRETSYRSFYHRYGYAVGYVPQNAFATLLCYQPLTVWEALWFHLRLRTGRRWCRPLGPAPANDSSDDGEDTDPMRRHICFWLHRLRLLQRVTLVRQLVSTLSGGEVKRLAIAMELICEPSVLWLDEPTSGLDAHTAEDVLYTLQCYARGMSSSSSDSSSSRRGGTRGATAGYSAFPTTWRPGQRVDVPVGCTPRMMVMVVHQPSYEMARFFIDRFVGVAQYPIARTSMSSSDDGGVEDGRDTSDSVVDDDGDAKESDAVDAAAVAASGALDAADASVGSDATVASVGAIVDVECGGVGVTVGHHLRVQREHVGSFRNDDRHRHRHLNATTAASCLVKARRSGRVQPQPQQQLQPRRVTSASAVVASLDLPMKCLSSPPLPPPPPPPPPSTTTANDTAGHDDDAVVWRLLEDEAREVQELTQLATFAALQSIPPPPPPPTAEEETAASPHTVAPQLLRRVNVLDNYLVGLAHPTTSVTVTHEAVVVVSALAKENDRRWIDWFPAYDTSVTRGDGVVGLGQCLGAGHVLTWVDHAWLGGLRAWTVMGHRWTTVWLGNVLLSMVFGFALGFFHGDLSSLAPSTMLQLPSAHYLLPLAMSLVGVQAGIRLRRHGYLVETVHDDAHDSSKDSSKGSCCSDSDSDSDSDSKTEHQSQPQPQSQPPPQQKAPSPSGRVTEERRLSEEGTKTKTKTMRTAAWSLAGAVLSWWCCRWVRRRCRDGRARWSRFRRMVLRSSGSRREDAEWTGYGFECVAGVRGVAVYCGECVAEAIWLGVMVSWLLVFFRGAAQSRSPFFAQWWLLWATGMAATSVGHVLLVVRVTGGGGGGDVGTWGVYMNLFCALLAGYSPQARDLLDTAASSSSSSSSSSPSSTPVLFQMVAAPSFTRDDPADAIVLASSSSSSISYAISSASTTHPSTAYRHVQRYRAHSPYQPLSSTSSSSTSSTRWLPFVNRAQWTASPSFLAPAFQGLLLLELQSLVAPSLYTQLRDSGSSNSSSAASPMVPSSALPVTEAAGTLRTLWRMYNVLGDCETLLYTLPLAPIHRLRYGLTVEEAGNATGRILRLQCPLHYSTTTTTTSDNDPSSAAVAVAVRRGLTHVEPTMWRPWGFYLAWLLIGYTLAVRVVGVCLGGTLLGTRSIRPPRRQQRHSR